MAEDIDIQLDIETLTIGEIEALEEITGTAWRNIDWADMPTKVMRALAFIAGRRQRPDFTLEDAGNVPLSAFTRAAGGTQPGGGAGDPTTPPSANGGG